MNLATTTKNLFSCFVAVFCIFVVACDQSKPKTEPAQSPDEHKHAHDEGTHDEHDHESSTDNSHRHGIHGGHIFDFQPNDLLGEWVQFRDKDVIEIFLLDSTGKSDSPQKVESLIIKKGDKLFSLDPESPDGNGASAKFSLDDIELAIAMNLGVDVEMTIGDKEYTAKIPPNSGH